MNNMTIASQEAKRESIVNGLEDFEYTYERLLTCLKELHDKIKPILLPEFPVDANKCADNPSSKSELHIRLSDNVNKLKELCRSINELIQRIDI
jgi:hypothetical protein